MKSKSSLILVCRAYGTVTVYAKGVFRIKEVIDLREATNYRFLWPVRWIALRNFRKGYPKAIQSAIHFENFVFLSGTIGSLFG